MSIVPVPVSVSVATHGCVNCVFLRVHTYTYYTYSYMLHTVYEVQIKCDRRTKYTFM